MELEIFGGLPLIQYLESPSSGLEKMQEPGSKEMLKFESKFLGFGKKLGANFKIFWWV